MKYIRIIVIVVLLLFVGGLAAWLGLSFAVNQNQDMSGILNCVTRSDAKKFFQDNEIAYYSLTEEDASVQGIEVFGSPAAVEMIFSEERTDWISVTYTLFEPTGEPQTAVDESGEVSYLPYELTEQDKAAITKRFDEVKKAFEKHLGAELLHYELLPTRADMPDGEEDELFYGGYVVREYSVRDAYGVLWLLHYEASFGSSSARLIKVYNETGYDGFVPALDLTKR